LVFLLGLLIKFEGHYQLFDGGSLFIKTLEHTAADRVYVDRSAAFRVQPWQ
jgi:hypothetical protein